jgi:type III pantothenate kinase
MTSRTAGSPGMADAVLLADVGNTRIKLAAVLEPAVLELPGPRRLPVIGRRQDLMSRDFRPENFAGWLDSVAPGPAVVLVAAVHHAAAARLEAVIAELTATRRHPVRQQRLTHAHLPIGVDVVEPARVGIDRVAAAAAAAVVKEPGQPAIVVDCGTATTVDMVAADGRFLGGAILPGPMLLARALADGTSRLPEVAALDHELPPAMPGRSTQQAIAAGIGWGMRGAVARLVAEAQAASGGKAELFLTGGSRGVVRDALPGAIEIPDLVLAGIGLAAVRVGAAAG